MGSLALPARWSFALLAAMAAAGCSNEFWDRSPRVGGVAETAAPRAWPRHNSPGQDAPSGMADLPPPEIRPGRSRPAEAAPYAPTPYAPSPYAQNSPPPARPQASPEAAIRQDTPYIVPPSMSRPPPAPQTWSTTPGAPSADEEAVLAQVNQIRWGRGLRPFRFSPVLHRVAAEHSQDQQRCGFMGHGSPDPRRRTLGQRMALGGYQGQAYAEVVAWGYRNPPAVVEGWMNSRDHRDILVDPELSEAAFARVGDYWTGNFGTPRWSPPASSYPQAYPAPSAQPAPYAQPWPRAPVQPPRATAPVPAPVVQPAPAPSRSPWDSPTARPYGSTAQPYASTAQPYASTARPYGSTAQPYGAAPGRVSPVSAAPPPACAPPPSSRPCVPCTPCPPPCVPCRPPRPPSCVG